MPTIVSYLRDDNGASAAEYAVILAIAGGAIMLAAVSLGPAIGGAINRTANCLGGQSAATCVT
jgi:pilus assembly protein Flp/PilA